MGQDGVVQYSIIKLVSFGLIFGMANVLVIAESKEHESAKAYFAILRSLLSREPSEQEPDTRDTCVIVKAAIY